MNSTTNNSVNIAAANNAESVSNTSEWILCAIKRPFSDHQSQLLALEEAFALRRLGPHPNIVHLIRVRDEVDLPSTSPSLLAKEGVKKRPAELPSMLRTRQQALGRGLPSKIRESSPSSLHGRSTSDTGTDDRPHSSAGHRRQVSIPDRRLGPMEKPLITVDHPDDPSSGEMDDDDQRNDPPDDSPRLLILLELLPSSLSTFMKRNAEQMSLSQWTSWALELASVVDWMHSKGCIHADLKPENILLTSDLHIKICDFNSALFPNPSMQLHDGLGLGTPAYGAPELTQRSTANSVKGFDYAVDIWSMGAILYALGTGREPFQRARSMIDILHRKRTFFETEEDDRMASINVTEGSSTAGPSSAHGGSTSVSRSGSQRGPLSKPGVDPATPSRLSRHKRNESLESVSSVASSLFSNGNRRSLTVRDINVLLDDSPNVGVLAPLGASTSFSGHETQNKAAGMAASKGHHRTASLGNKTSHAYLSPDSAQRRRSRAHTSSRNAQALDESAPLHGMSRSTSLRFQTRHSHDTKKTTDSSRDAVSPGADSHTVEATLPPQTSDLSTAVTEALARSQPPQAPPAPQSHSPEHESDEPPLFLHDPYDSRPYADGYPAIVFPGGGRLPEEARMLLRRMLCLDAGQRPTAAQVYHTLRNLLGGSL